MHYTSVVTLWLAWCTWVGLAAAMRYYFRWAKQKNPAKTLLTASAFVCTLIQLAVLSLEKPPSLLRMWTAVAGYGLANVLFWWSLSAHGKLRPAFAFIGVKPASFTRNGPYRLIRHPIYSAYLLGWMTGTVVTAQPWLLATVVWMLVLYYMAARQEEECFAQTAFAGEYAEYQKHTGMFLPALQFKNQSL